MQKIIAKVISLCLANLHRNAKFGSRTVEEGTLWLKSS